MNKSTLYIGAAFLVGAVGAVWWLRRGLQEAGGEATRGVTTTAKSSNVTKDAVVTTPIKRDPAFVAPATTLTLIPKAAQAVFDRVRGFVLPAAPSAKAQPFGNVVSQRAAYTAPIRPEYKPTAYGVYNRSNVQ